MTRLTHDEIVTRERGIFDSCIDLGRDPIFSIAQDRATRYAEYTAELVVRPDISTWIDAMTAAHGEVCRFYNSTVGWALALLITRYGEAEYHWPDPTDGFTDEDVDRAQKWLTRGAIPAGCFYL